MAIIYEHSENGNDENVDNIIVHQPEDRKGTCWSWLQTNHLRAFIFSVLAVLLILALVLSIIILFQMHNNSDVFPQLSAETDELQSSSPADYLVAPNVKVSIPGKLWIVSRREWSAKPPKEAQTLLQLPVRYVIIMHTATETCSDQASCTFHARVIQDFNMDNRGWDDIGYNFMVGGDGNAYEGRGWKNVGAQVYGYNTKCIGIAFIGTFNTIMPTERQLLAAKQLIQIGLEEGYIAKDYKLLAARQLQSTQSPGLLLYEEIKTWPHWAKKP